MCPFANNLAVPWKDSNVQVVTKLTPFPSSMPVRRIGVNAFGYGGTNAHAVLESVDSVAPGYCRHSARKQASHHVNGTNGTNGVMKTKSNMERPQLLLFSAHDKLTLQNNLADYERSCSQFDPTDLAYTLGHRRSKLSHRAFAVVDPKGGNLETEFQTASTNILAETGKAISAALVFTGMYNNAVLSRTAHLLTPFQPGRTRCSVAADGGRSSEDVSNHVSNDSAP